MKSFFERKRSRRLRKKLRVGEFQEFGFDVKVVLANTMTDEQEMAFIDDLIVQVIDPKALVFAGWVRGGFIAPFKGTATDQDREDVRAWFKSRPEVTEVEVGELRDAWWSCEDEDCDHHH
jgi:uncharacterized protein YggL (DUF469 family)